MAKDRYVGVVPPIVTPVDEFERVDEAALRGIVRRCKDVGLHGVFVAGSNGECMALTQAERNRAIRIVLDEAGPDYPVMSGVMDSSTQRVIDNIKALEDMGGDVAVVTPVFYARHATQDETVRHFEEILRHTKVMELICCVVNDYGVVMTNTTTGWTSLDEMAAYAKEHPGEVKLGTTGVNTVNYADTLRLMKALGIENDITVVPFDGGSAANTALLGNQIQLLTMSVSDTKSYVASGDFYGLVVFGEDRAKALPDTPCSKELGIDITTTKPRGYYAPAGTSQEVLDLLADAIEEVTKTEEFATRVEGYGWEINFVRGSEMQPKIEAWAEELAPVFQEILNAN